MKLYQSLILLVLSVNASLALAEEHRHHGPHEHGAGKLDIAMEGRELSIALDSPAANIIGFEHAPHSEADHKTLEKALAQLKAGSTLFNFPDSSQCRLVSTDIETPLATHEEHHEEGHSDINATWNFNCADPEKLDQISVKLFEVFPRTNHLQVQFITETEQSSRKLTASQSVLRF